ncbi:MAG TPA: limonene-1,2-epoxide hydrolase, partial [Mycobacterium sp.]|nr:limonene-1,2-epoxide hydrolase [Mycobacterium sp.]
MKLSPDELVTEFCKKWLTADPDELAGYFTEDAVCHNIPMEPV